MNILHVNASDITGGAARATYRIHRTLVEHGGAYGISSEMRVIYKASDDPSVIGGEPVSQNPLWRRIRPRLIRLALANRKIDPHAKSSIAWLGRGLGAELLWRRQQESHDLLHLHWIGDFQALGDTILSIEEIGRLPKPLVWTLHDQWAFSGSEHINRSYVSKRHLELRNKSARWSTHNSISELNRWTCLRKRRSWKIPMHLVCPSSWLAKRVQSSCLMSCWPITVIPHPIDLRIWAPWDQLQARKILQLPTDRPLVLFGAIGGMVDPNKGSDLLLEALQRMRFELNGTSLEKLELVVFGQGRPAEPPDLGFPIHYVGRMHDDISLRLLYAAADVMVVPSREEAFGQTASEAQACGTPVVAFATSGLTDVVDNRTTGILAEAFEPLSLAAAIRWVLEDPQRRRGLGSAARQRAEQLWNPARIAGLYAEVYSDAFAILRQ